MSRNHRTVDLRGWTFSPRAGGAMMLASWVLLFIIAPSKLFVTAQKFSGDGMYHYYVSIGGNDAYGDGSPSFPWRTLQYAADHLSLGREGAIVHVSPGTYDDMRHCSLPGLARGAAMVCMHRSGTPTQPIIFRSDEQWGAHLRCDRTSGMFMLAGSYIQVIGFEMSCPKPKSFAGATYGNNSHNQFLGNYLHDFDVAGCTSVGVLNGNNNPRPGWTNIGHHTASGNIIRHAGAVGGAHNNCNQEHGIYFGDPYDVITNNLISGIIGWGIHAYGSGICHQVISNNVVFDNSQGGIRIENVTARGGRYWDQCANGGIADYNTVTNNIVVNNGYGQNYTGAGGGIDATGMGTGGSHNVYSNNLLYGNHAFQMRLAERGVSLNQFAGSNSSVFANYQPDKNWAPERTFSYWNYMPRVGGPAEDAGTTKCAAESPGCPVTVDFVGVRRPHGVGHDVGAFEVPATIRDRLNAHGTRSAGTNKDDYASGLARAP